MPTLPPRPLDEVLQALGPSSVQLGWRWRAVALWTVMLVALWLGQAWWLSQQLHWPLTLKATPDGELIISDAPPTLEHLTGLRLQGVSGDLEATPAVALNSLVLQPSARWLPDRDDRDEHRVQREALAELHTRMGSVEPAVVWMYPEQGAPERILLEPFGWRGLGLLYWLISGLALALACVGGLVWLSAPSKLTTAYALTAWCASLGLGWAASGYVLGLHAPLLWLHLDPAVRLGTELLGLGALAWAMLHYPRPLRRAPAWTAALMAGWLGCCLLWWGVLQQGWPWWGAQLGMLGLLCGVIAVVWHTQAVDAHPLRRVLVRFVAAATAAIALISVALTLGAQRADLHLALTHYGLLTWKVFVASLVLTYPFLARTRTVFQEFSWLAVSSTVAASLDVLFVAVFSMGVFTSMTLSLFLAFGLYLFLRRHLLNQLPAGQHLSREALFDRLYRATRRVERHPETLKPTLTQLLQDLFEPMHAQWALENVGDQDTSTGHDRLKAHGTVLLVPLPEQDAQAQPAETLVLKHAHHGQRLFTVRDARLAQYIARQLAQASRWDAAVEQGRSEERMRIAQDLHDDIGARLLTLMYQAPNRDMEDYIRHTLQDLKTLTRGLAASSHLLSDACSEWKRDLSHRIEVAHCHLGWQASWDDDVSLTMVQWSAMTRILRELVSNALAHAHATQITVELQLHANALRLNVVDNGQGSAPDTWAHGLGLGGIRKRVKQLGGTVRWQECPSGGIRCEVLVDPFVPALPDPSGAMPPAV